MADTQPSVRYCLACGTENVRSVRFCRGCGQQLTAGPQQRRQGLAFVLNELERLRDEGEIEGALYRRLRDRYLRLLNQPAEAAPAPAPGRAAPPPAAAKREGPGWLAEQQANLLLYLGAFLIVIAALVYIGTSGQAIADPARMAVLVAFTLAFLAGGVACLRFERVRQAGLVFFAVGALMVPINFVGAYGFFFADDNIDPTGLWLAGSLVGVIFYAAVSMLGMGRWYPVPTVVATFSSLAALLVLSDAPPDAYPGSFIALALLLSAPSALPLGRVSETFGQIGSLAAHVTVPIALMAALSLTGAAAGDHEGDFELATRWYLPPTAAIAALFYWVQTLWARRGRPQPDDLLTVAALAVTGGALVTIVFALDVGNEWYGPAVASLGWLYAFGSEPFGPRWFGRKHLGWMALAAVTVSWLFFEGMYADFPRHGAGVHFAAAAFYLSAARLMRIDVPMFRAMLGEYAGHWPTWQRISVSVPFMYAAGLTLGIGYYFLLASLPAAEGAQASDASWPFFGLSAGIAAAAASMRWWWRDLRLHVYVIAAGMSLFVLLSAVQAEGAVTLLLVLYAALALAITLWELEPLALALPASYGFFAVLAAWRYYGADDAYLALVISAMAYAFFAAQALLRDRSLPANVRLGLSVSWPQVAQACAFAYALAAPVVGWVRLAALADERGFVGAERFEATLLYQTSAASVLLLAFLVLAQAWLWRRLPLAAGASALMMVALLLEIGHFRPENAQAYTAPLGVYLLAGALLALRVRGLPKDVRSMTGPVEALGALLIMAPSFVQSLDDNGWRYGLILLAEALAFVALALVQRRLWLLGVSLALAVLNGVHYLFFAGGPALPNWAILALAGTAVMAAGTAILLGRDRWTVWQRAAQAWWSREPLPAEQA